MFLLFIAAACGTTNCVLLSGAILDGMWAWEALLDAIEESLL